MFQWEMSLPEELELIHFDSEPHPIKKEQKESKKQGKRSKGSNSKKTSSNNNVPSDPSLGTGQVRTAQYLIVALQTYYN